MHIHLLTLATGEDEETKKQKQKAMIEAAFKVVPKAQNDDSILENGDDNNENCEDGKDLVFMKKTLNSS